jgi:hypothetical protein
MKDIPQSWIILILLTGLIILRAFDIDTWTTAALSTMIGYITGKHIEQRRS